MNSIVMFWGFPGGGEWLVIFLLILLLFGAKKLPEIGKSLGAGLRNFKKGLTEGEEETEKKEIREDKIKVLEHEEKD